MRKKSTLIFAFLLFVALQTVQAANINITISGFTYSPASTTGTVGDVVTITASANHPNVEVDQTTWNANGNTPKTGGFGVQSTTHTFTITTVADIYFVCQVHASMGMKGMITVTASGISQATAAAYNISMYPNPVTNGDFTVKVEGYNHADGKVMLYDVAGKLLESHNLTGVATPIKTKLPGGVYFYTVIIGDQKIYSNKFVVTTAK